MTKFNDFLEEQLSDPVVKAAYDAELMEDLKSYTVDYEDWHFESYWNEVTASWSVYQVKKKEDGYEARVHCFRSEPVKTIDDAKYLVDNWLELRKVIFK